MKIAFLSFYSGLINRGVETWTHELANRLSKLGHEITVFQGGPAKKGADYRVVEIVTKGFGAQFNFAFQVGIYLLKERYDIVVPNNGGWQLPITRLLTLLTGSKVVFIRHASNWRYDLRHFLWKPTALVSPSPLKNQLKAKFPFASWVKTWHIPHGVNLRQFNPEGDKFEHGLTLPVVLCVAEANSFKRVPLAVEGVANSKASFLYTGSSGEDLSWVDKLGGKLLAGRYKRISLAHRDMPNVYRSVDLFTLPSDDGEAFGIVYLEALASNLPIVAMDDELRREIVGEAGILVDPTNIGAYAKAIEKTLATDWGNKPRKQAEKFSWDKIAKQYEEVFSSLIK